MAHSFTIKLTGKDLVNEVAKIKSGLITGGGKFEGDICSGKFSGSGVSGYYITTGDTIEITITKKPFIAPMSLVENKIRSYFDS